MTEAWSLPLKDSPYLIPWARGKAVDMERIPLYWPLQCARAVILAKSVGFRFFNNCQITVDYVSERMKFVLVHFIGMMNLRFCMRIP